MGRLTTHVLDTAAGSPAVGLLIELFRLGETATLIGTFRTNSDGRIDGPLLTGEALTVGVYELVFHAGDYLRAQGLSAPEPLFLDVIPLRFGVSDPSAHYHVPLLLSPYSYSTYRGS